MFLKMKNWGNLLVFNVLLYLDLEEFLLCWTFGYYHCGEEKSMCSASGQAKIKTTLYSKGNYRAVSSASGQ